MSAKTLDRLLGRVTVAYLVIRDCISYILNEAIQGVGVVHVVQELQKPMLFGQLPEPGHNPFQLPARTNRFNTVLVLLEDGVRTF